MMLLKQLETKSIMYLVSENQSQRVLFNLKTCTKTTIKSRDVFFKSWTCINFTCSSLVWDVIDVSIENTINMH